MSAEEIMFYVAYAFVAGLGCGWVVWGRGGQ